ncbi:hypothetical protein AVEN_211668-1 [Araneus ventricosus]|uniref:Uncharacterized protein n=1 Tax=Araneus ventricosus TaxID=182803 RepID=A0A4Y2L4I4_ARAVE|nr:hypothetical protein AVEN_211668-1 [Araneus ventricosus]
MCYLGWADNHPLSNHPHHNTERIFRPCQFNSHQANIHHGSSAELGFEPMILRFRDSTPRPLLIPFGLAALSQLVQDTRSDRKASFVGIVYLNAISVDQTSDDH